MAVLNGGSSDSTIKYCREDSDSVVRDELDVLHNVYFDEMKVLPSNSRQTELQFHLTPSTADDKDRQYVFLDLQLTLPLSYPHTPPEITLLQSRGLADTRLHSIREGVCQMCLELLGGPMIYEVVESVKDALTESNSPCGECALCLFDFMRDEEFTKTACYHYFHTACLVRYVHYHQQVTDEEGEREGGERGGEREGGGVQPKPLECPVCRETISHDSSCLKQTIYREGKEGEGEREEFVFVPSRSLRKWQHRMAVLLRQQKERGGVIDLTAKDDVIDLTWVSQRPKEGIASADKTEEKKAVREKEKTEDMRDALQQPGVARDQGPAVHTQFTEVEPRSTKYSNSHSKSRYTDSRDSDARFPDLRRYSDSRSRYQYRGSGTGDRNKQSGEKRIKNGMRTEQPGNETVTKPSVSGSVVTTEVLRGRGSVQGRQCSHEGGKRYEKRHDYHSQSRQERSKGRDWEGGSRERKGRDSQEKRRVERGSQRQWNGLETRELKHGVMEKERVEQSGGREN